MMRVSALLVISLLITGPFLLADQVTLKNGDRLTGSVVKLEGGKLLFKAEPAGEVTLPWDSVSALKTETPVHVGLKGSQAVAGPVTVSDQSVRVETQEAGEVTSTRGNIEYIRSKEAQAAYETEAGRLRNPRIVDLWTGFVDLGISQSRGNARTSTVSTGANASRATSRDKISVSFTSLYASNSTAGPSVITANAIRGGINYNLNVSPKLFAFASTDLEFDEFQKLDLRFSPAGGFGFHWIKTDRTTFDLFGGAGLNREFFSTGLERSSAEATLGQEFLYKLNDRTSFREKLMLLPNLTERGEYRMNFDVSAVTAIWKWLGWQVTFSDRLLSNPVPGRKKNDVLFTTGVRLTFGR